MRPGDAYWPLVSPIWNAVSNFERPETFCKEFVDVPVKARTLLAVHWCQSEVCNGGFHQFFWNSTGILAPEATDSFRSIGMPQTALLVKQAMQWFGEPYPRQRKVRKQQLDAFTDKKQFDFLDNDFFSFWKTENGGFLAAADAYALSASN
jgi:hypothetical protein